MSPLLKRLGIVVVVVPLVIGYMVWKERQDSQKVRESAYARYEQLAPRERVKAEVDKHHDECFDECYRSGGRRRSASFDADKYAKLMDARVLPVLAPTALAEPFHAPHPVLPDPR